MKILEAKIPWWDKLKARCRSCDTQVEFEENDALASPYWLPGTTNYDVAFRCPSCGTENHIIKK